MYDNLCPPDFKRLTLYAPIPTNCLSVFDHFVGLALKRLTFNTSHYSNVFDVEFNIFNITLPLQIVLN